MSEDNRVIAIGLLTAHDLQKLGPMFSRAYPVQDAPLFDELLAAIEKADRELQKDQEASRGE